MNRLRQLLTISHEPGGTQISAQMWGFVLAGVVIWLAMAYVMAWVTHDATSLTLNAYDLAEWTTLTPSERQTAPPLMAALWLRLHLVAVVLLAAWGGRVLGGRGLAMLILLVGCALQLPPPEFVANLNDVNYQQQFGLAMFSGLLGLVFIVWKRVSVLAGVLIGITGVIASFGGLSAGLGVIAPFMLAVDVGMGFGMMVIGYGVLSVLAFGTWWKTRDTL